MSTAHRPTWAPAQARDIGSGSRQVSVKDIAAQTKLKFRQPGQGTSSEISRRDLRLELQKAERAARNKRKGITEPEEEDKVDGVPKAALIEGAPAGGTKEKEDEQAAKRRKLLEEAAELDRDDSDDEEEDENEQEEGQTTDKLAAATNGKGKEKATEQDKTNDDDAEEEDEDEEDSDDDDDEDDTAELLRELNKIKRERAEEKERLERERASSAAISAEEAAATGNPLLNLQAALNGRSPSYMNSPGGSSVSGGGSFQIKKRWDDDVIFKNQANKDETANKEFVNDLIRTSFHRRFLSKYIA